MRKIVSVRERGKNKRRNQVVLGVLLMVVMLFSVVGYSFQGSKDDSGGENYNGFDFVEQDGFWYTTIGNNNFVFSYNPKVIERVKGQVNGIDSYSGKPVYIFSEDKNAEVEIYRNLFPLVQRIQNACPEGEICDDNSPTKTCEDNFIIIKESETSGITQQQNCVFVSGTKDDLVKISDEFLFKILNIVQ